MMEITFTKENFDAEVRQASGTVLVDFWASWCMPCRLLAPILDAYVEKHPEIKLCKVNIDDEPELAQEFGIMSIPTLMTFQNGAKEKTSVGQLSAEELEAFLS